MLEKQHAEDQIIGKNGTKSQLTDPELGEPGPRDANSPIALDSESIYFIERLQQTQSIEVFVMTSKDFRNRFIDLITQEHQEHIPFANMSSVDKTGQSYSGFKTTVEDSPHIIYTEGAYPCSIVIICDDRGNAAIAHMTQFQILDGDQSIQQKQMEKGKQTRRGMARFAQSNLTDNRSLIITATNLDKTMRSSIVESIILDIRGFESARTGCIFTDEGNHIDSRKDVPEGKLRTTADSIDGAYFVPKQLTKCGKNIVILVGDDKQSKKTSLDDWEWRQSLGKQ